MDNCMHGTDARSHCPECDEQISRVEEAKARVKKAEREGLEWLAEAAGNDDMGVDHLRDGVNKHGGAVRDARAALKAAKDALTGTIVPVY